MPQRISANVLVLVGRGGGMMRGRGRGILRRMNSKYMTRSREEWELGKISGHKTLWVPPKAALEQWEGGT